MSQEYWAKAPRDHIALEIENKWAEYHSWMQATGLRDLLQELYNSYYSFTDGGFGIAKSKNGSTAKIKVQHYKALIQRVRGLVTQAKLSYVPKAINSDSASQIQADFAKGLLEYYEDDKGMTQVVSDMVERGLIMLDSYVYAPWDFTKGDPVTTGHFSGDQVFKTLSRFDVCSEIECDDSPFYIVRETRNKFELAAMYPDQADAILAAGSRTNPLEYVDTPLGTTRDRSYKTDQVEMLTLLHRKTLALKSGRQTIICGGEVLADIEFPYRTMPVVKFSPAKMHETVLGDSPATMLFSLQQAIDALYSATLSNNLQYSRQNIWSPSPIQVEPLSEGFNNIVSAQKPEALQLVASSPETYNFITALQAQQQILSGINDTARGSPEASLKSGTSLALMLSVAIQFVNETQKAYSAAAGELASIVIANLQQFAEEPRLAYIGGLSRKSVIKEFTAKDLMGIKRVACDLGNPLMQNIAGRYELVQQWQQFGIVKDPKQIVEFLRTGQVDSITEDPFKDTLLIRAENEALRKGEQPPVMATDLHPAHILEHKQLANDPEMRRDAALMENLTRHLLDHIDVQKSLDPDLAAILGIAPLPSQQMAQQQPQAPQLETPPPAPGESPMEQSLPNLPNEAPEILKNAYAEGMA